MPFRRLLCALPGLWWKSTAARNTVPETMPSLQHSVQFKIALKQGRVLFQARQQAAVAADLLLTWRRCHNEPLTGQVSAPRCLALSPHPCHAMRLPLDWRAPTAQHLVQQSFSQASTVGATTDRLSMLRFITQPPPLAPRCAAGQRAAQLPPSRLRRRWRPAGTACVSCPAAAARCGQAWHAGHAVHNCSASGLWTAAWPPPASPPLATHPAAPLCRRIRTAQAI